MRSTYMSYACTLVKCIRLDNVSKKHLKVLDRKLRWLATEAELEVTVKLRRAQESAKQRLDVHRWPRSGRLAAEEYWDIHPETSAPAGCAVGPLFAFLWLGTRFFQRQKNEDLREPCCAGVRVRRAGLRTAG